LGRIIVSAFAVSSSLSSRSASETALAFAYVKSPVASRPPVPGRRACRSHAVHISLSAETVGIDNVSATSWVRDLVQLSGLPP
jgi:hypothetical protein